MKARPMNMVFQEPRGTISIGMFQAAGFTEVPEARFIMDMAAGFMSAIFMLGMFMPGIWPWAWASVARVSANRSAFTGSSNRSRLKKGGCSQYWPLYKTGWELGTGE